MKKTLIFTKTFLMLMGLIFGSSALAQDVVITEIMYNPPESGTDTLEYIEFFNNTANVIDLENYSFDGVQYTFPAVSFAANTFIVIAKDSMALVNT